ncbi:MAG: hypothetical protein RLZZ22_1935, partial [Pseudomonadota bacterium]
INSLINASTQQVEQGSTLVLQAGESVSGIVNHVDDVTLLIEEISGASQEQLDSISQINDALSGIDGMTQYNSALVEESAAATERLMQEAHSLSKAASAFRLGTVAS